MRQALEQSADTIAQHSYTRCLRAPDFFEDFYDRLLASDDRIPPMFSGVVEPRQHKLLQHGLGLLLSYGKNPDDQLLERLAVRHSANGINVPPPMYAHFVRSLVSTIEQHDPKFTGEVEAAWRDALRPGIEFMQSRYEG